MRTHFDEQLRELNRDLTRMGALCEDALTQVVRALTESDQEALNHISALDPEIDRMERRIENACLQLLLQQQPVARDLRQISAALKMITDMERIGDQAEDIAEIIPFLGGRTVDACNDLCRMAGAATKMVTDSVDAFVRRDLNLARAVMQQDDGVDQDFARIKAGLIQLIRQDASEGEYALDLLMIAKYLERIGDHATNIAEWVEYTLTGVHRSEELEG